MPQPLLDRMEIIRIAGYTEDEKVEIAKRHLIAKQAEAHGLKDGEWSIADEALRDLIRYYTARGRRAERWSARSPISRARRCKEIVATKARRSVDHREEPRASSPACASSATARPRSEDQVGVVTGLAWTEVGGELLTIESVTAARQGHDRASPASSAT
jgi:ATP-dependent Lon protease